MNNTTQPARFEERPASVPTLAELTARIVAAGYRPGKAFETRLMIYADSFEGSPSASGHPLAEVIYYKETGWLVGSL